MYKLSIFHSFSRVCLSLLLTLVIGLSTQTALSAQTSPATFNYTGDVQTFTVPAGVTSLTVVANGGQGADANAAGGKGGRVTATLAVTAGQVLNLYVGGGSGLTYNGGGGTGGGGASDIRIGGTALTDRVLVAGGGAAASNAGNPGGAGGGLTGGDGGGTRNIGRGGTQSAGGAGVGPTGTGQFGIGGSPGGGGGYYGGGGGTSGSSGGGSSYTDPTLVTNVVHEQGVNTGNGQIVLSWASPLPVSLLYFNGRATPQGNLLEWKTTQESDNAGFTILRGASPNSLEAIGSMASQATSGNASSALTYAFLDNSSPAGLTYYRLAQTDFSGAKTLSALIAIRSEDGRPILFPNPAPLSGQLTLEPPQAYDRYELIDASGKIIQSVEQPGTLSEVRLPIGSAGTYWLRLQNGTAKQVYRIIK